jgi:hypothetical protein
MRRRCSDEEDNAAAIVRGATSRASGELSRFWRLETHQEALTGTTATWGWEAARGNTVSKQTPVFIRHFNLLCDSSHKKQVTEDVS